MPYEYYDMDVLQVHTGGQQVTAETSTATQLAQRYGTMLTNAEGAVTHPTVAAAVRRYSDLWKPKADQVAGQVEALGVGTSGSAVTISETDQEAASCLHYGSTESFYLNREINQPLICPES